jgi:hypothetical protein
LKKFRPQNESGRTLVRPLDGIKDPAKSEAKTARPQYETHASVIYFDFFLAFFFFAMMMLFLGV